LIAQRRAHYAGLGTRELYVTGAGPTIVLLHGFADSADSWRDVLVRLERAGLSAVAVDLAGFGQADPLAAGPQLPQHDRFVAEVIARHAVDGHVVLAGNSLGGLLAVRAAESERGLPIRGILAIDAAGTGWTPLLRAAIVHNLTLVTFLAALPTPSVVRRVVGACAVRVVLYGEPHTVDPATIRRFVHQIRRRGDVQRLLATAVCILAEVNAISDVGAISCPAIVLHGRRDRLVSVAAAHRLHAMIPHSRFVLLPRSGHCPQLDAPERVAALTLELTHVGSTPEVDSA
jgi:pimeloyl-ACP methyl ester carboxylesterase